MASGSGAVLNRGPAAEEPGALPYLAAWGRPTYSCQLSSWRSFCFTWASAGGSWHMNSCMTLLCTALHGCLHGFATGFTVLQLYPKVKATVQPCAAAARLSAFQCERIKRVRQGYARG